MSKVIAARIKNVLPSIIHHNQTGFIKDRYIGETVRSIFDIMELTVEGNIPGLMIFIDFQKAFDSLEWNYLLNCLEHFNFGSDFFQMGNNLLQKYTKLCHKQWYHFRLFYPSKRSQTRRPLSPYLFVFAAEVLAIAVRQNK